MNKKLILMMSVLSLCVTVSGCSKNSNEINTNNNEVITKSDEIESIGEINTYIKLGTDISVEGNGATVESNKVIISSAGTYSISGKSADGQIIVEASKKDKVNLLLDGVDITSSNSAPIYVKNADKTVIALAENTENTITDGSNYVLEDEANNEPNAAIFSMDDLTIIGNGSLKVSANYNNGITSKDDLKIKEGNISVNAVSDGLRGKDSITISGGNITINAQEDGMKSTNIEETEKGYILIEGGNLNIKALQDGIQADNNVIINDGEINISTGSGSANASTSKNGSWGNWGRAPGENPQTDTTDTEGSDSTSAKGIKATNDIDINGGNITIDSSDDSIHSNNTLSINNGSISTSSGDDGIHANSSLEINNGTIDIQKSYEGIEGQTITINDGSISVIASDDGMNAAGGNDGSSTNGRPGQNSFASSSNGLITINGGNLLVNSSGDGIDSNGSIVMSDGTVIVNGPTDNGNGALDYDGTFDVSGGLLIAAGSLGMAQSVSQSSTQNAVIISIASQEANTLVNIKSTSGDEIITFAPSKAYQSVVVCSPLLKDNTSYIVSTGGESTGTNNNGLYVNGKYSSGTEVANFTVSGVLNSSTQSGVSTSGMGNPGGMWNSGTKPGGGKGSMGTMPNMNPPATQ